MTDGSSAAPLREERPSPGAAFHAWRWATIAFANLPNLLMVLWVFFVLPRTEGTASAGDVVWNVALFAAFALSHSAMATERWGRWFRARFPAAFERPVYMIVSGISLLALIGLWRPLPRVLWQVEGAPGVAIDVAFWAIFAAVATVGRAFDQGAFMGTRALSRHFRGLPPAAAQPEFVVRGWFRHARHPMYFLMIALLWCASTLTLGRALFAALATAYFVVGLRFEEARLAAAIGPAYAEYREHVPALLPRLRPWRPEERDGTT